MEELDTVYMFCNAEEEKPYTKTTWYRCVGIQDFIKKVLEKREIVGVVFSGNNIGLIIDEKKPYNAFDELGIPRDTKMDCNLIVATTEDGIVFFTRADLIVYPGLKLDEYMDREL